VSRIHIPGEPVRYDGGRDGAAGERIAPRTERMAAMRISSGSNGRRSAASTGGRPTCDEVYAKLVDEFLRHSALGRDEAFAAAVARRFHEGPAKFCCRAIGGWIETRLLDFGWTQQDLAARVGVDRSAVAKWTTGGSISFGHLVLVLLEFQSDFSDLPLPARAELALEGYLAALEHVRARLEPGGHVEPLDRERFWCLYHLLSEPNWERAIRKKDRGLIVQEVERVLTRAGESLGHPTRDIKGVDDLRRLVEGWTAAWVVCLELLPGDWPIR
jgi:transcriptional regulator with XRE-family HTH domain